MTTTAGSREGIMARNNKPDLDYWRDRMKDDVQFMHYMTDVYKKQQLDIQLHEQREKNMTHHPRSSSFSSPIRQQQTTRHLPQLMDNPISSPSIKYQDHNRNNWTSKTSTEHPTAAPYNQTSSTPRRPLEDSGSEYRFQRQAKKSRPHEPTPATLPPTITTSSSSYSSHQIHIAPAHLKRAINNNLPCFYINFENETDQFLMPSAMKVASWLRQTVQQQSCAPLGDFSILIPAGKNRYKFGVASKKDFLMIWNCKWPNEMDKINVEIQRPRSLPDCCAAVIRFVPEDLPNEFVVQEVNKSIRSAVSFSRINYHRPRSTKDYRFCITDENEYNEIISIGRIAIGHILLPVTAFIPGIKMTYCNNCWELGHTRPECKGGALCRKCLDPWDYNHVCEKPVLCAQCKGPHSSLSMDCMVVSNYRRTLKNEVNNAVKNGLLQQVDYNRDLPAWKRPDGTHTAWLGQQGLGQQLLGQQGLGQQGLGQQHLGQQGLGQQGPANYTQNQQENKQVEKLMTQINAVLVVTSRMEIKMDQQMQRIEMLEKISNNNKQGLVVLTNIIQQIIHSMSEKKNKQQLQILSKQIEDFKGDVMGKCITLTADQHRTPTSPSLPPTSKQVIKPTTSSVNGNNNHMEQEHSMNITDGQ
jgi:hypothetical protein